MADQGLFGDSSGLLQGRQCAALLAIQGGTCATCDATARLEADHDHATGLLRGLLCKSCNNREGKSRSGEFDAYRANPPAGAAWFWDFPDDWSQADTDAVRKSGLTSRRVRAVRTSRPEAVRSYRVDAAAAVDRAGMTALLMRLGGDTFRGSNPRSSATDQELCC